MGFLILGLATIVAIVAIVAIVFGRGFKGQVTADKLSIEVPQDKRQAPRERPS